MRKFLSKSLGLLFRWIESLYHDRCTAECHRLSLMVLDPPCGEPKFFQHQEPLLYYYFFHYRTGERVPFPTHGNGSIHPAIQRHPLASDVLVHAWDSDDFFALMYDPAAGHASGFRPALLDVKRFFAPRIAQASSDGGGK